MVTEKLDTHVHGTYINKSEVCKNEENVQISQVLCQTHPHSNCNVCRAAVGSQPRNSMLAHYVELHVWVIKKVRGLHYLKPNQ